MSSVCNLSCASGRDVILRHVGEIDVSVGLVAVLIAFRTGSERQLRFDHEGEGVAATDPQAALGWYRRAADAGHGGAVQVESS